MRKRGLDCFKHPRDLLVFGLVSYLVGFVFSALERFEYGYIRSDAFWLGSIALFAGASLWISMCVGYLCIGKMIARGFFVTIVAGWIFASFQLIAADLHIGVALFLIVALGVLVYGVWFLTWWPTLTIDSEHDGAGQPPTRRDFE